MKTLDQRANESLLALRQNKYPGRGLIIGPDQTGTKMVQIYWIMGRSENSRNRKLVLDGDRLYTEAIDPDKVTDRRNIFYNAMKRGRSAFVVSNGNQTDWVADNLTIHTTLATILRRSKYEDDAPNFTSRITGVYSSNSNVPPIELSILRKAPDSMACERQSFQYENVPPGFGYCLTTYSGDGDPLPPFCGEPLFVPLPGDDAAIHNAYLDVLSGSSDNLVALAVKHIDMNTLRSTISIANVRVPKHAMS